MQISIFQAILIGLVYYLGNATWLIGIGYYTMYRPLVNGFFVGLILGNPVLGTMVGATINLMYLGFISAGGALPGDPCLAGTLGTAIAIASGIEPEAALALAVPIGLLGTLIWFAKMTVNAFFVHKADQYAEEGNTKGIAFMDIVPPQIFLFIITFFPVFFAALYGPTAIKSAIDFLGTNVLNSLIVIGGMMPALGIAMNLKAIFKGDNRIFYFLGFLLTVYLKLDIIAVGLFGVVLTLIYMKLKKGGSEVVR